MTPLAEAQLHFTQRKPWVCWYKLCERTVVWRCAHEVSAMAMCHNHNRTSPEWAHVAFDPNGEAFPMPDPPELP